MQKFSKVFAKPLLLAGLCLSTLLVTSCLTTIPTAAINASCVWDGPISYSSRDTPDTINQIRKHNAAWRALCKEA